MLYREMPKTGEKLSILGFGCMRFPGSRMRPDEEEAIRQIRGAIDRGVNYLDTAWTYHGGKSEVILGKALKDGYREKVRIADKLPHWLCKSREDMDYYLDEQLKRLDDTVIDYYLVHALNGGLWEKARDAGVLAFMDQAKAAGKIVNAGFSFHGSRDEFKDIVDAYDWDFCLIQLNILDEHDQAGVEGLEYAASKGIGVMVMEPLRGGVLAGELPKEVEAIYARAETKRSNAEWALRWVWNHPGVITVLSGMNNEEHIAENIRIASEAEPHSLTDAELGMINQAGETFRKLMKVPCTGCQYCMPCPKGINIPLTFSLYNSRHLFRQGLGNKIQYLLYSSGLGSDKSGLASQCVGCGLCMEHCPQKINIPAAMKQVKREYEGPLTRLWIFLLRRLMTKGARTK